MIELLPEPAVFARSYASLELARRALQRINSKLSANTGAYVTAGLEDDAPVVAAITLTEQGRRRLKNAAWGGNPHEPSEELREQLLARLAYLQERSDAGTITSEGYVRRGPGAGVEIQPDGTTTPVRRPQG
jgi:ABC-type phosphonate transport system ATPase subunit